MHPYFKRVTHKGRRPPHLPATGWNGAQMAAAYGFPTGITATPPKVFLIELGGSYSSATINSWAQSRGFPMPTLTSQSVLGAVPSPDPGGADVEVGLDIVNVIGAVFYMFSQPSNIVVVFAPNTSVGFAAAVEFVAKQQAGSTCGISWGGPESSYGASGISAMEAAFALGDQNDITFCVASGDNGPDDGTSAPTTDYPGCSAGAVDCGATTVSMAPHGQLLGQVPWNSGGGASGGGFSKLIPIPAWQKNLGLSGSGRGEPDCVANGDPATGWDTPFGIVGGTSAVAPFMAAYFAGVNALLMSAGKAPLGLPTPLMYANANPSVFSEIQSGSIGQGFPAGPGPWNVAAGLGSVIGTAFAALALGQTVPIPPTPPQPLPPVAGLTLAETLAVIAAESKILEAANPMLARLIARIGAAYSTAVSRNWPA